jgi:hypothetical protein
LHHSVPYRRNAQRPLSTIGLRDVPAQHRCRPIRACAQRDADRFEKAVHALLLDVGDRLGIDARRTLVPLHSPPRFLEDVTPPDPVEKRVEAPPG